MGRNNSGKWLKQLFPDEALKGIGAAESAARDTHRTNTLYWPDEGWGLLPTVRHFDYVRELGEAKQQFEAAVREFLARLDEWTAWAKREHNGSFDPAQYDRTLLAGKFHFSHQFRPLPESSQFSGVVSSLIGSEAEELDKAVNDAVAEAQRDLWRQVLEPVANMARRLKDEEGTFLKATGKSVEAMVQNVREIAALVPELNVSGDADLNRIAAEITNGLAMEVPEVLRNSAAKRKAAAARAEEIVKRMAGYVQK